jgi:hypothetical protein
MTTTSHQPPGLPRQDEIVRIIAAALDPAAFQDDLMRPGRGNRALDGILQRREAALAGASAALGHIQQEGWRFCRIEDQDGSAVPHSDAIDPGIIDALTSGLSVAFPEPRLKARF